MTITAIKNIRLRKSERSSIEAQAPLRLDEGEQRDHAADQKRDDISELQPSRGPFETPVIKQ